MTRIYEKKKASLFNFLKLFCLYFKNKLVYLIFLLFEKLRWIKIRNQNVYQVFLSMENGLEYMNMDSLHSDLEKGLHTWTSWILLQNSKSLLYFPYHIHSKARLFCQKKKKESHCKFLMFFMTCLLIFIFQLPFTSWCLELHMEYRWPQLLLCGPSEWLGARIWRSQHRILCPWIE